MTYPANHPKSPIQNIAKGLPYMVAKAMVNDGIENYMTDIGLEFWNMLPDNKKRYLEDRFIGRLKMN